MDFLEALEKLKQSTVFKEFSKEHKDSYLTHGFIMLDANIKKEWQIGYYSPKKDNIITFCVNGDIMQNPEEKVFKKEKKVLKLDTSKIKVPFSEAIIKANEIQKKKHPKHEPIKKIYIIQHLSEGQIWNVTYVTQTFNTLNIKIDSETGKIVSDNLVSLFRVEK
ncbi:hypothetical protein JXB41_04170 [Candidatus Woesearchaeota archaeon]|nr:hypothetical protein [Candidatus Woesearchaeota archaeon]